MAPSESTLHVVATVTLNPAIDRTVSVNGLVPGAVNRAGLVGDRPGGKGINVAAALAEQGLRTAALGFLGRENEGVFTAFFSALGIQDRCLRLPGATRTGIKIIDTAGGETTDLNFPGLSPGVADMAVLSRQLDTLDGHWCVLAGSLPPGVPGTFYRDAVARMKARGVRVALDTSGEALGEAIAAAPDFIKPNVHELEAHVGRELQTEAEVVVAARELIARGVGLVVVSRGADGACFVTADEVVSARPPSIEVGSTVGAGDAMVAGIVAAQVRGLSLPECARLATAFSLFALTRDAAGPQPRAAVAAFAERVEVMIRS